MDLYVSEKEVEETKDKAFVLITGFVEDRGEVLRHCEDKYGWLLPSQKREDGKESLVFLKSHWDKNQNVFQSKVRKDIKFIYKENPEKVELENNDQSWILWY